MKKISAMLFSLTICALISMLTINPAQAHIEEWTWLPPYIEKVAGSRVVYRHGSTASLLVPVKNDLPANALMNVSKVIIAFDWGENKTLDLSANPKQIESDKTELFMVSFTADATEAVSSDWAHEYTIHVEHVNATTGPTEIVDTWSRAWNWPWSYYKFVVFSTDQADALDLSDEYDSYSSSFPAWTFTNINASQLAGQANIEASLGGTHYTRGEYDSAKTHYETALNLYSQALAAENQWRTKVEEAELEIDLTEAAANMAMANAMLRQADAAVNQSYAWIVFGLGFVFMGIATIIYAIKKPKIA